jgi:hypothetical protein
MTTCTYDNMHFFPFPIQVFVRLSGTDSKKNKKIKNGKNINNHVSDFSCGLLRDIERNH